MKIFLQNSQLVFASSPVEEDVVLNPNSTIEGYYMALNSSNGSITKTAAASRSIAVFDLSNYVGRKLSVHIPKSGSNYGLSVVYGNDLTQTYYIKINETKGDQAEQNIEITNNDGYTKLFVTYTNSAAAPTVTVSQRTKWMHNIEPTKILSGYYIQPNGKLATSSTREIAVFDVQETSGLLINIPKSPSSTGLCYAFSNTPDVISTTTLTAPSEPKLGTDGLLKLEVMTEGKYLCVCSTTNVGIANVSKLN